LFSPKIIFYRNQFHRRLKIMTYTTLVIIRHGRVEEEMDTLFSLNSVNIYIILYRAVRQTNIIYYSVLYSNDNTCTIEIFCGPWRNAVITYYINHRNSFVLIDNLMDTDHCRSWKSTRHIMCKKLYKYKHDFKWINTKHSLLYLYINIMLLQCIAIV